MGGLFVLPENTIAGRTPFQNSTLPQQSVSLGRISDRLDIYKYWTSDVQYFNES